MVTNESASLSLNVKTLLYWFLIFKYVVVSEIFEKWKDVATVFEFLKIIFFTTFLYL